MRKLVWPLLIENLLRMALSSVDVFMLSMYSDRAVAAVGLANQFSMFLMLIYSMVGTGAGIILAQTLGAKRYHEASDIGTMSLALAALFGTAMSLLMFFSAPVILSFYTLEPQVHEFALQYMRIFGAGSMFLAFNVVQSNILRTCGHSRDTMVVNMSGNLINVLGNWIAVRGLSLGFITIPVTGVVGVASATVFSQAAVCLVFAYRLKIRGEIVVAFNRLRSIPKIHLQRIIAVGIPSAGEGLAYNMAQIMLMNMASTLGTAAMSAWVYNSTIMRFVFVAALAIAVSAQINVGHMLGAGQIETAYRKVYRYYLAGVSCSILLVVFANIFKTQIFSVFTSDDLIIQLASRLMLISIFVEIGRAANLIIIHALKGAADVRFPVIVGVISMWGVGVLGGYTLGIRLGLGVAGVWAGVAIDEFLRGIIMLLRWRSKAWTKKVLVSREDVSGAEVGAGMQAGAADVFEADHYPHSVSPVGATASGVRVAEDVEYCSCEDCGTGAFPEDTEE